MDSLLQCLSSLTELPIKAVCLLPTALLHLFSDASRPHPLFSSTAAGTIVFLYLPHQLLSILFSPVLLCTLFLLYALFHYGLPPRPLPFTNSFRDSMPHNSFPFKASSPQKPHFSEPAFFEPGSGGGPLEIICEECEREEEEDDGEYSPRYSKMEFLGLEGFCYMYSDMENEEEETTAVGGWESPESLRFQWEEEGEGLIEIALEEDYMFEIDISAYR